MPSQEQILSSHIQTTPGETDRFAEVFAEGLDCIQTWANTPVPETQGRCRCRVPRKCVLLAVACVTLAFTMEPQDLGTKPSGNSTYSTWLEEQCLHTIGQSVGCSPQALKVAKQFLIMIFKRKTMEGREFFSFDISPDVINEVNEFRQEYHIEFSERKEDVIHHSGFARAAPRWQFWLDTEGGLTRWLKEVKSTSQYPDLVVENLNKAYTAFVLMDDRAAKTHGYWSHWNTTTVFADERAESASRHSSGIVMMQLNKRDTVDVFVVYHEANIFISQSLNRWCGKTIREVRLSESPRGFSNTAQEMCQWLVYHRMLNLSRSVLPDIVHLNVAAER